MSKTPRTDKAETMTYVGCEWVVPVHFARGLEIELNGAVALCQVYFEIAAECIGETEVRKRRDARIANISICVNSDKETQA